MAKKLSDTEIKNRLQQLRNITMLHARAIAKVAKLERLVKAKDALLLQRDQRIAELETALLDKEAQRKALADKFFKAKKQRSADQANPKPGAQPGHQSARRPAPRPEEVTDPVRLPQLQASSR